MNIHNNKLRRFITKCLFDWIRVVGTIRILNQQTTFSLQVRMTAEYWMMNVVCVRALVSVCECVRMCARACMRVCIAIIQFPV